jgi:tripartite-type tricarboxylate transporter receptor subunit TctC
MTLPSTLKLRHLFIAGAVAGAMALTTTSAFATEFPTQPIRVIVPTDPGGAIDGIARVFQRAFELTNAFDYSLAVINMAGAGGTVGTRALRDAEPDGHTIGTWHDGIVTSKAMGVVNFDHEDFEIIGATGVAQLGLAVSRDSRFASFQDLLDFARENPDEVTVGVNIGLPVHFVPMQVAVEAGVELRYVQAGGGARRLQSVVGGHTDLALFSLQELQQFEEAGLRTVLLLTEERVEQMPDVPTARELGIDVVADSPRIWLAPKNTPADRLEKLQSAFRSAFEHDEVSRQLIDFGLEPRFVEPETVEAILDQARARTTPLVDRARQVQQ